MLRRFAAVVSCVVLTLVAPEVRGEEQSVTVKDVPQAARTAASNTAFGVRWTKATKTEKEGKPVYHLQGRNSDGEKVTVSVTGEGKVQRMVVDFPLMFLPVEVTTALKTKRKDFTIDSALAVFKDGNVGSYDLFGKAGDGKAAAVNVSADGKTITEIEAKK